MFLSTVHGAKENTSGVPNANWAPTEKDWDELERMRGEKLKNYQQYLESLPINYIFNDAALSRVSMLDKSKILCEKRIINSERSVRSGNGKYCFIPEVCGMAYNFCLWIPTGSQNETQAVKDPYGFIGSDCYKNASSP